MASSLTADPEALAAALTGWMGFHARDLPWRRDRTPYRVWLSEVMLQQTRVDTVVAYFERFTARFPTVKDLARAPEDEVLSLWSGLGYYRRGRNLHRAAQVIQEMGSFPDDVEGLAALPGIGRYTAGAIASLAFGRRVPIVDGNVARVFARLEDDATPLGTPAATAAHWARAGALVEAADDPGLLNESLMELGALVCVPKVPRCEACPWLGACRGESSATASSLPVRLPRRARVSLRVAVALLVEGDHVWLEKNDVDGLFGGLYAPPSRPALHDNTVAIRTLLQERGLPLPRRLPPPRLIERTLTHRDLTLFVVRLPLDGCVPTSKGRLVDVHALDTIGLSAATRAVLKGEEFGANRSRP